MAVLADEAEEQRAERDTEPDGELLDEAAETGRPTELGGGGIGVRERIGGHELSRAYQTKDEDIGADQPMRRARLDQRETRQDHGTGNRTADQHPVESERSEQLPD